MQISEARSFSVTLSWDEIAGMCRMRALEQLAAHGKIHLAPATGEPIGDFRTIEALDPAINKLIDGSDTGFTLIVENGKNP